MEKQITYGMVGGDIKAFIGEVHRKALNFDTRVKLVSGCFSIDKDLNYETAAAYSVDPSRVYEDFKEMARVESTKENPIDFVVITTPNHLHYAISKAFLEAGINVVCEKPLCFTLEEAQELQHLVESKDLLFGLTYTYTGFAMAKVMKQIVENGEIGEVISVNGEYSQEWLIDELDATASATSKLSGWRTDPEIAGISNCVGDIGTHIECLVGYVTGLKIKRLLATTDKFGQELDLNANIIVEYENGARGAYWTSQVAVGKLNGLAIRVYGTKGSLEWDQHYPDYVRFTPKGQAPQILSRGCGYITGDAAGYSRLPSGHPEGLVTAFANIYKNFITAIEQKKAGEPISGNALDFPSVEEGFEAVKFVHAVIKSGNNDASWVTL